MSIKEKGYAVQCIKCIRILGISNKDFQEEEIYCMRCANEEIKSKRDSG